MNGQRAIAIQLHDVAPACWEGCSRVLRVLRALAQDQGTPLPVTLLVVPRWHANPATPEPYLQWLRHQLQRGHGMAIHGYTHRDDGPPAAGWRDRLRREIWTAGEGEFAALDRRSAAARLAGAQAWAAAHGLPAKGFVPPGWLLNGDARHAAADAGFDHLCTFRDLQVLPDGPVLATPALIFSTRARWRRTLSCAWNPWVARRAREAPLLRLDLHPDDAEHADVRRCWTRLLRDALGTRTPVLLADAAAALRAGMPPALRPA